MKQEKIVEVAKPEHMAVMGKDKPEFPNECRSWRGYARVPTDGGLKHLCGPLGVVFGLVTNGKNFFIAGKSDKWLPYIGAMKRCEGCQSTYPAT